MNSLSGTWGSPCQATGFNPTTSTLSRLIINADGTFENTTFNFLGSTACANGTDYSIEKNFGTFDQSSSHLNAWVENKRTLTAMSPSALRDFNQLGICNRTNWSLAQANDCAIPENAQDSTTYVANSHELILKHCARVSNQLICSTESRTRI